MRVGVVHTVGSPCRCAESVSEGLVALHHEAILVNSEQIETEAATLAESCDIVIDHTDTFRGRGFFRPLVRQLLENCGARVLGSSAKACFVSDDKAAAKKRLSSCGIPTPPGIPVHSSNWALPEWLHPPLVVKPVFEHMSRGVRVVASGEEARIEALRTLEELHQPVLVEQYIPGRELAVCLIEDHNGLQVLPLIEWQFGENEHRILTEEFKLMDPADNERRIIRPDLSPELAGEIEDLARTAFRALELRDYGRFDIRLAEDGSLFFLEANTTPSFEPCEALAVSAGWAGYSYAKLVERLLSAALGRYETPQPKQTVTCIQLPTGPVDLEIPAGVHALPQSTIDLAAMLDVQPGDMALELGCGSGLLSITMAKLGASRVVATDLDSAALEATRRNAKRSGVEDRIEIRAGSWYQALTGDATPGLPNHFDIIVANPPQTPGPHPFGPKYGGHDGTLHLTKVLRNAHRYLKADSGRLWLMTITLANPRKIWTLLEELFSEVRLVGETERRFSAEEYEKLQPGLFEYLRALRVSGAAEFTEQEGQGAFANRFIRASIPRI